MRAQPSAGEYKVLGWDAVGEVSAIGENVSGFKVGDKVWYAGDITRAGANSEYHLVDERIVGKQPASLSNMHAAVRLLIIGAAGGVGSILSQLALALTNATVIGTASRKESKEWLKGLALDYVIDHSKPLSQELARIGIEDVTHVISLTHTDSHYAEIVKVLAPQGQLALIDDPKIPLDIMQLKLKSISLHWELMFTKSMFKTADMHSQGQLLNAVSAMVDQGKIVSTLAEHYGLINAENLKKAHAFIESGKAIGKVVLAGF
ncbi:MAG: zinc-binding alcohol dehydrogenase family protein [Osedax symbiont Rs1]|nr:MAG: zinc-binding alcohol dehydrogenase family protein [Osedax symbiont Rs1]